LIKIAPTAGRNAFPVLCAPQNALVRLRVSAGSLDLKVIDTSGAVLETLSLPARRDR
jgi:hypothetical protein